MEFDHAFTDEPAFPEGWPDYEFEEILLGDWREGKSPSSVAMRRYLAELVRFMRADLSLALTPAQRLVDLRAIREFHRKHLPGAIEVEASVIALRKKILPDWKLWCARPKGGVQ